MLTPLVTWGNSSVTTRLPLKRTRLELDSSKLSNVPVPLFVFGKGNAPKKSSFQVVPLLKERLITNVIISPPVITVSKKIVLTVPVGPPVVPLLQKIGKSHVIDVSSNSRVFFPGSNSNKLVGLSVESAAAQHPLPMKVVLSHPKMAASKMFNSEFDYTPKHPLTGEVARGLRGNLEHISWTQHLTRSQYLQ